MHKKMQLSFSNCMKLEIVLVSLIILFTILKQNALISLCFSMSFIVLLVYAVSRTANKRYSLTLFFLVAVSIFNVVVNALISPEAQLSFDYFKKLLMFIAFMLLLNFAQNDTITYDVYRLTIGLPCIMVIALIFSYFFAGNTGTYAGGVTLGFSNSNFTGMWLVHLFIYVFLYAISIEKEKRPVRVAVRIAAVFILAIMVWLINATRARSCLIGIVVFLLLCVAGWITRGEFVKKPVVWGIIILIPIIFVPLYLHLLNTSWFGKMFSGFVSEGKGLDSRLLVWKPSIEAFLSSPILGDYCRISHGRFGSQLHNTHLDVLCSYGVLPFILFMNTLYKTSRKITKRKMQFINYAAFSGFLAVIVVGIFEAGVVSGAMGLNILTAGLVVLSLYKVEK